jgi:serine/threonine protein phosphatase 1
MIMYRRKIPKNELGRDFVCGDLHGAYERLKDVMKHINFDPTKDRMFSVGDLVDRGPRNEECLRLLNEPWFFAVQGNHEQLMAHFYDPDLGPYGAWWSQNGGQWGVQYGPNRSEFYTDLGMEMRDLAKKASELPLMMTVERQDGKFFHIIHAELSSIKPITDADLDNEETFNEVCFQQTMDGDFIIWGRFIFYSLYNANTLDKGTVEKFKRSAQYHKMGTIFNDGLSHIYSGHTIMRHPTRFMGQTNIDTGAYGSFGSLGVPYSREETPADWKGLTVTEPLTDKFWKATYFGVKEVEPVIL